MSFQTSTGTRGSRQPTGLLRWLLLRLNKVVMSRIRRKGSMFMDRNALVLTTIGAKSGAERTTPVGWFPGEDDSWLIVASAAGAAKNPAWYHNIAAHPDQVHIELAGRSIAVTAEQLNGADREKAWQQITTVVPQFARYQERTDRQLPIIRLVPRSG